MPKKVPATKVNLSNPDVFQLKASFQPALNKEGASRLTFLGYEHSVSKDGENSFMKLVFSVMDVTGKNPENIPVLVNYKVSVENKVGKVLNAMGIEVKEIELVEDEDGFMMAAEDVDYSYIYEALDTKGGLVYLAVLTQVEDKPGLYRIDIDSLKPFVKEGVQVKATVAA
jgi:hypothetical protein